MTKTEYLELLRLELKKNNVADMADILAEYEQHFAFKLADGHSEEEIAARLGAPQVIAAQFDSAGEKQAAGKGGFFIRTALFFAARLRGAGRLPCRRGELHGADPVYALSRRAAARHLRYRPCGPLWRGKLLLLRVFEADDQSQRPVAQEHALSLRAAASAMAPPV